MIAERIGASISKGVGEKARIKYFDLARNDIKRLYKTQDEIDRVTEIFDDAHEQSRNKKIKIIRKPNSLKNFLVRWKIRFKYGIHWNKPLYPFRLIRNYSLSYIYKLLGKNKHVFRGIEFALTFRCNFTCHHCLCANIDESDTKRELGPDEYSKIVKEAMKLGATTFGMEGGEPFMKKNWVEIVESWQPHYNHIQASSNGYLFDEKVAKKCAELGVDTINFSLDSGIPELHDIFRQKKGSYDRVMRAIDLCDKYKIKVILNTVVSKANLYTEGLIELFEFAEKRKLFVNVLFAKDVGEFKDKDGTLTQEDFEAFHKLAEPYNYWHIHHEGKLKSNNGGTGCPGVKEMVNMTPYGDVINCANNHVYLGNVRDESLASIRERALTESPFGKYRPCFLTKDEDFMNIYYPLLKERGNMTLDEFRTALSQYEETNGKEVYQELCGGCSSTCN